MVQRLGLARQSQSQSFCFQVELCYQNVLALVLQQSTCGGIRGCGAHGVAIPFKNHLERYDHARLGID
jgi:hypothetical protein